MATGLNSGFAGLSGSSGLYGGQSGLWSGAAGLQEGGGGDTAPANTVLPAISGTAEIGQLLTASTGTWTGTAPITYAYQWKRGGVDIGGATASTYTLTVSDSNATITVTVTATNAVGSASATSLGAGPVYRTESVTYFTAMSVQPDTTLKADLNTLVNGLIVDTVWAELDWLNIPAIHDEQAARVNAKNPSQVASVGVAPTFTANRGYTGNGTTQYINTGINTSTAGGLYLQNDCHMGGWIGTEVDNASEYDFGTFAAGFNTRNGTVAIVAPQSNTNINYTLPSATSIGHTAFSRTSSTAVKTYKNGSGTSATNTSIARRNAPILICALNSSSTGTVTPTLYSTRRVQAFHFGGALSDAQMLAMHDRLATYMAARGA